MTAGKIALVLGASSLGLIALVFMDLFYTKSHWALIESQHTAGSVLMNVLLVMFPIAGVALALLSAGIGFVLALRSVFQKTERGLGMAALGLIGAAICVGVTLLLGMGSFRQG
jgi:hypothetical protein